MCVIQIQPCTKYLVVQIYYREFSRDKNKYKNNIYKQVF